MSEPLVSTDRKGTVDSGAEDTGKFPFDAWEFTSPSASAPYVQLKDAWKMKVHDLDVGGDLLVTGTLFSRFSHAVKTDDYVITDTDALTGIVVNASSAKTMTLPTLADNQGRVLAFVNKGSGEAVVDGEGAETIEGFASVYLGAGDYLVLMAEATEWKRIAGAIQPVTAEPPLGTLHMLASPSAWNAVSGGTQTSFTDVDVSSLVPVGTRGVLLQGEVTGRGNGAYMYFLLCVRKNGTSAAYQYCPSIGSGISASSNGNDYAMNGMLTVGVDANRVLEYMIYTNSATKSASLAVLGYFRP